MSPKPPLLGRLPEPRVIGRRPLAGRPLALLLPAALTLAAACSDASGPGVDASAPCLAAGQECADRVEVTTGRFVPIFRSHDLDIGSATAERAVIVIHGTGRDYDNYFASMVAAVLMAGDESRTVLVAPRFQTAEDGPAPDEPYWTSSGWKKGHLSSTEGPRPRVSSYTVLDEIVRLLADDSRFPALEEVVVTGHSAGGQVLHRYAATGEPPPRAGLGIRYVVANPSTYLYLGDERAAGEGWAVPDVEACPDYDVWHYGLENLNSYADRITNQQLVDNLVGRPVTIMVGDQDTGSSQLDVSCGADLQGPNRYERGLTLVAYMGHAYPGHDHELVVVPGVAHSSRGMYTSPEGLAVLFP